MDLPSSGTYNLSLAMGDGGYAQCSIQCQVQFLDGSTVLATVNEGLTTPGYFYDAVGNNWSAAAWPASNLSQQVTLTGTRLTVVVGTSKATGDITPIAFLGVAQGRLHDCAVSGFAKCRARNQSTPTIATTISGGFNSSIRLSGFAVVTVGESPRISNIGGMRVDHPLGIPQLLGKIGSV